MYTLYQRDTYITVSAAEEYIIAKIPSQLRIPSEDEWIKKICTVEYDLGIKNEIVPIVSK